MGSRIGTGFVSSESASIRARMVKDGMIKGEMMEDGTIRAAMIRSNKDVVLIHVKIKG